MYVMFIIYNILYDLDTFQGILRYDFTILHDLGQQFHLGIDNKIDGNQKVFTSIIVVSSF